MPDTSRHRFAPVRLTRKVRRIFARFRESSKGATTVEFAMVSVPFMALLFAIFETAFVFFATQGLEAAVNDAARSILTGQAQGNAAITTATGFRDAMICNPTAPKQRILPSFIDCSKVIVDVRPAGTSGSTTFTTANTAKDFFSTTPKYCTGAPNDVVVVRAVYPMPIYLSIVSATNLGATGASNTSGQTSFNGGMVHMIMGVAAFRNEPFPSYAGALAGC